MRQQPYQAYQRVRVETASPPQLLLALYDGAVRFLGRARAAQESGDREGLHRNLVRTQDIVVELMTSLDLSRGGVAQQLMGLYVYVYRTLVEANVAHDGAKIEEIDGILRKLRDAWREAVRRTESPHAATGVPAGGVAG